MSVTIPPWMQRPVVPADTLAKQSSLSEIQAAYAAEGSVIPVAYGEFQIGGRPFVAHFNSGTSTWTVGYLVCMGPIESITNVWVNGAAKVAGTSLNTYTGTSSQVKDPLLATAIGASYTDTLVLPIYSTVLGPDFEVPAYEWTLLPGAAYVVLQYTNTHYKMWPDVIVEGKGRKVFDPALPNNTIAYSTEPALFFRDFVANIMLGRIDNQSVIEVALANARLLTLPNLTSIKRRQYTGVVFDRPMSQADCLDVLRAYAGCWAFKRGMTWHLVPDIYASEPNKSLTAADFVRGTFKVYSTDPTLSPTVVNIEYTNKTSPLWTKERVTYSDPGVAAGTVGLRESTVAMPGIQYYAQAIWEAAERQRKLALGVTFEGVVTDENLELEPGDLVDIQHYRIGSVPDGVIPGNQTKRFRITEAKPTGKGRQRIAGVEYSVDAYDMSWSVVPLTQPTASGGGGPVIGNPP